MTKSDLTPTQAEQKAMHPDAFHAGVLAERARLIGHFTLGHTAGEDEGTIHHFIDTNTPLSQCLFTYARTATLNGKRRAFDAAARGLGITVSDEQFAAELLKRPPQAVVAAQMAGKDFGDLVVERMEARGMGRKVSAPTEPAAAVEQDVGEVEL